MEDQAYKEAYLIGSVVALSARYAPPPGLSFYVSASSDNI